MIKDYPTPFKKILTTQDMVKYFVNKEAEYQIPDVRQPEPTYSVTSFPKTPAGLHGFASSIIKSALP